MLRRVSYELSTRSCNAIRCFVILSFLVACNRGTPHSATQAARDAGSSPLAVSGAKDDEHAIAIMDDWLTMTDGVRLSVTYYLPAAAVKGERFPVLFEMLPYRKDDMFYKRDYSLVEYFARHGF